MWVSPHGHIQNIAQTTITPSIQTLYFKFAPPKMFENSWTNSYSFPSLHWSALYLLPALSSACFEHNLLFSSLSRIGIQCLDIAPSQTSSLIHLIFSGPLNPPNIILASPSFPSLSHHCHLRSGAKGGATVETLNSSEPNRFSRKHLLDARCVNSTCDAQGSPTGPALWYYSARYCRSSSLQRAVQKLATIFWKSDLKKIPKHFQKLVFLNNF